ncbi:MAG TPA: prolyl oligopeptidase family serine peptidase [Bacteroidales bacterium]|nr:prolyl oligopeptidase family serine peptidase [Bacteroidales bacterium]HPJ59719.1 prolyl oligopeptidase family serine peptidase [Bacteroidales bacterium]HPR11308.1 prolyl oligopeptidase family serine peptidase [Bacteroidales bacterium]HRW86009.1 prolyl oligopeptidase family serine peptidase [Bacteroidales bacterium]
MKKQFLSIILLTVIFLLPSSLISQSALTIEKIMQGDKFTGISPSGIRWSAVDNTLYFNWTENADSAVSTYTLTPDDPVPQKISPEERKDMPPFSGTYNRDRKKMLYTRNGDIFLMDLKKKDVRQITSTAAGESNPYFSLDETKIIFSSGNNLFSWNIDDGSLVQITDLRQGRERRDEAPGMNKHDRFLYEDQLKLFNVLAERKEEREKNRRESQLGEPEGPEVIYTGSGVPRSLSVSPDGKFLTWLTAAQVDEKRTIIPSYVTESGYTETTNARSKVGMGSEASGDLVIYDLELDTLYRVRKENIPGITELPDYVSDYPGDKPEKPAERGVSFRNPLWSEDGNFGIVEIFSADNKDRWIMLLDIKTGGLKLLDRQHDEAWTGGPGIGYGSLGWLPDNKTIWFQSEETGYSHLYTLDVITGQKKALTSGKFEVYNLRLSNDKRTWYFISNETDPGVRELYSMPLEGGIRNQLTSFVGGVEYEISPDEKYFALRVSHATEPWELYLLENRKKAVPVKITSSTTPDFDSYKWRTPEFISFRASDGVMVPARLYRPSEPVSDGPAVIFVHGAGYLQNAHRWWSSYFREYMFHNMLVDNGYTVLDIDYRGSAGYGRDWRTAIYRHMGGRDLEDHVDGAKFLVDQFKIDPQRIGIYGGSYGGFITLMGMFTKPGVFRAGAALRPVTDWAHYNHGYTSDILNIPVADSLAYVKSSPIYFAGGLQGHLLICHGMIDDNVHFQDVVRLAQKLIELGRDNWELAVYPVERHSFTEPSSWTDEYKRIFRLFEENLK